ncbi:MAG: hypothetical protein ACRC1K_24025 [Planctomycetia bacterium]
MSNYVSSFWRASSDGAPQTPFVCDDAARSMKIDVLEVRAVPAGMVDSAADLAAGPCGPAADLAAGPCGLAETPGDVATTSEVENTDSVETTSDVEPTGDAETYSDDMAYLMSASGKRTSTPAERTASTPRLSVSPASGRAGSNIPLRITAALTDTDGSERLSVRIGGVPAGASFSAGTNRGGGVWRFTAAQLTGLRYTPPANANGDVVLSVTATSTESNGGATATTNPVNLTVSVAPANQAPRLANGSPSVIVRSVNYTAGVNRLQTLAGYSDADATSQQRGVAITKTEGAGVWQWRNDGETRWRNMPPVSSSRAFLLRAQASVRFVPNAGTSVDGASLSFKGWDQTAGRHGRMFDVNQNTVGGTKSLSTETSRLRLSSLAATGGQGRAAAKLAALDEAAYDKPNATDLAAAAVDAILSAD